MMNNDDDPACLPAYLLIFPLGREREPWYPKLMIESNCNSNSKKRGV